MSPKPGEVWLADLGLAAKTRPVVIVSRFDPESPRALVLYVPLTTQNRNSPYEVGIPQLSFLNRESFANVQGLSSIPSIRLERKLGRFPTTTIAKLKAALAFVLELVTMSLTVFLGSNRRAIHYAVLATVQYSTFSVLIKAREPQKPNGARVWYSRFTEYFRRPPIDIVVRRELS